MRIPCPHCGERSSEEFSYLGDAAPRRPRSDAGVEAFLDYVYQRENLAGPIQEYWYHRCCRGWIVVSRDTRDHRVMGAVPANSGERA
jgi:methylglutamate dehydrogenase subunit B